MRRNFPSVLVCNLWPILLDVTQFRGFLILSSLLSSQLVANILYAFEKLFLILTFFFILLLNISIFDNGY